MGYLNFMRHLSLLKDDGVICGFSTYLSFKRNNQYDYLKALGSRGITLEELVKQWGENNREKITKEFNYFRLVLSERGVSEILKTTYDVKTNLVETVEVVPDNPINNWKPDLSRNPLLDKRMNFEKDFCSLDWKERKNILETLRDEKIGRDEKFKILGMNIHPNNLISLEFIHDTYKPTQNRFLVDIFTKFNLKHEKIQEYIVNQLKELDINEFKNNFGFKDFSLESMFKSLSNFGIVLKSINKNSEFDVYIKRDKDVLKEITRSIKKHIQRHGFLNYGDVCPTIKKYEDKKIEETTTMLDGIKIPEKSKKTKLEDSFKISGFEYSAKIEDSDDIETLVERFRTRLYELDSFDKTIQITVK